MGEKHLDKYAGRTILLTGGCGCIGSNLTRSLIDAGSERIIVIDDLSSSGEWNLPDHPAIEFIRSSILDEEGLKRGFAKKPDLVFHLAAHFANQNSVDQPETDLMVNGLGTLKVLEYSRLTDVSRFIFASSGCSVYGTQAPLPLKEDYVSIELDTPYQITKLLGELYCNYFHNLYGMRICRARFFNVYGPGEMPGRYRNVIPNFLWWAMHKKPLPITGTGEETRDFTYVGDIVDGVLRIGSSNKAVGEAINLASETETRVIDIAEIVNKLTDNKSGIIFQERRNWDKIIKRRASIQKARSLLGYNPKTDMETGVANTYTWIKEHFEQIESLSPF